MKTKYPRSNQEIWIESIEDHPEVYRFYRRTDEGHLTETERREARKRIDEALENLSDRDAALIRLRFGLDDGDPKTLDECGKFFRSEKGELLCRDRVRQLEQRGLRKMRHPSIIRRLEGFLNIPGA